MKKSKTSKPKIPNPESENGSADKREAKNFLIVGIGASAGGIQAFKVFFENVRTDSGAAYVVILHLSPDHDSQLAKVLQTVAPTPVTQVTKKVWVEPNHVYVVPPNQSLSMADEHIIASPIQTVEERRAPVDVFLERSPKRTANASLPSFFREPARTARWASSVLKKMAARRLCRILARRNFPRCRAIRLRPI